MINKNKKKQKKHCINEESGQTDLAYLISYEPLINRFGKKNSSIL